MNWREVRSDLRRKLAAELVEGAKHDFLYVKTPDGKDIGRVKMSHGNGELRSHEIGGVADSLGLNEHNTKALVSCTLSAVDYFAMMRSS